ncbi:MAG: hypothetical protein OSB55_00550 [Verrucomicrobiota bacterium]|nr:hypothetical protein [Verrucomicrobiota bacterium]
MEGKSGFFVEPGGSGLLARDEYTARYRSNNGVQASNAIEVSVMYFNALRLLLISKKSIPEG